MKNEECIYSEHGINRDIEDIVFIETIDSIEAID